MFISESWQLKLRDENQFFLRVSDPNSNTSHMVQDTYAIHLSWHICRCCGREADDVEHIFKLERKERTTKV